MAETDGFPEIEGADAGLDGLGPLTSDEFSSEGGNGESALQSRVDELESQLSANAQRLQIVEAFERDPVGTIQRAARELGISLGEQEGRSQGSPQTTAQLDQAVLNQVKQALPPEMQFMADDLAKATLTATQSILNPVLKDMQDKEAAARVAERDRLAAEMDKRHPDWRSVQGEMADLYNFLKQALNGGSLESPKFGSAQQILYNVIAGDRGATTAAASRMRDAAVNASSQSQSPSSQSVDVGKLIREAKTPDDKMRIAFRAALSETGVTGN